MSNYPVIAPTRLEIPEFLNSLGFNGFGVEVGVQKGLFSSHLIGKSQLKKVYLVDMWRKIPTGYNDIANVGPHGHLQAMMQTFLNVYNFGPRAVMIRDTSVEAAELFPDQSLDFVYLDGDHSYEGVAKDITAWYPKVREGGILAGHDFINASRDENKAAEFGVRLAVEDFAQAKKKEIMVTGEPDGEYPSWLVRL